MLQGTPSDTQLLSSSKSVHDGLGESFSWMLTRHTLQHVSQSTVLGIAGRKRVFKTEFAHPWRTDEVFYLRVSKVCCEDVNEL